MGLNPRQVEVEYDAQIVRRPYSLEDNKWQGFNDSVHNGQTRLALEHLLPLVRDLIERIGNLENRLGGVGDDENAKPEIAKTATRAKVGAKKEDPAE